VPISLQNLAGFSLSIIGAVYIGRLGALPLSASVLANSLYNCTGLSITMGLAAGMETLCGQVRSWAGGWVSGRQAAGRERSWL
jgi:MATE family multidrug resistance protein